MEKPKQQEAQAHAERIASHMARLREQYPGVIEEDLQYYIVGVVDKDGNESKVHIHKWEKIPVQIGKNPVVQVPVWDVIDAHIRFRHLFGRDDYSLAAVLQKAGILT